MLPQLRSEHYVRWILFFHDIFLYVIFRDFDLFFSTFSQIASIEVKKGNNVFVLLYGVLRTFDTLIILFALKRMSRRDHRRLYFWLLSPISVMSQGDH